MHDQARRANRGLLGILAFASACAAGDPPTLTVTGPTQAVAGQEVMFTLYGTDPDGDALQFGWNVSPALSGRGGEGPQLTFGPNGEGLFKWTPLGRDVGRWAFEFTVDDGHNRDAVTVGLDVQSASADNSVPSFVKPSGAGTSFDPMTQTCLEIEVAVADQDTPTIELALMPPSPTDAMLEVTGGHEATLHWCPSATELQSPSHTFVLSADDGDHEPVEKTFNVVIGDGERPDDDTPDDSPSDDPDDGGTPTECMPDANESDDSQGEARPADVCPSGFLSEGNTICAGDEDWYLVQLYNDETVTIRVNHTATDASQQLDLWFYGPGGPPFDNLTPCEGGACPTYTTQGTFFSHWVNDENCGAELCSFWLRVLGGTADTQNSYSLEISIDKSC